LIALVENTTERKKSSTLLAARAAAFRAFSEMAYFQVADEEPPGDFLQLAIYFTIAAGEQKN
jgi:hypothetical protein